MAGTRAAILDCMIEATILVEEAWALDVHTVILPTLKLFQPQDSFVGEKKNPSILLKPHFFFLFLVCSFDFITHLIVSDSRNYLSFSQNTVFLLQAS